MLLFQLIVGGVKLKQTLFFVIRNGNKILVELFNNNQYILPNISDHDSLSSIENMIKKKYNLEITTLKEQFSCNSSLCFEAFAPHKIEQNNAVQYTWISIKSAINYTFANIDNTLLKKLLSSYKYTDIQLQFGIRNEIIVHISEISENERGLACSCTCPACGVSLQARLGNGKRRPHFAHHNDACNIITAQETALHILAKEILQENQHIILPAYTLNPEEEGCIFNDPYDYDCLNRQSELYSVSDVYDFHFDNVVLEKNISDIIPDILISKKGKSRQLIVEIAVTHFVDEVKKKKIEQLGVSAIEIDISHFHNQEFDRADLKEVIIDKLDSKKWIYNIHYEQNLKKLIDRNKELLNNTIKKAAARELEANKMRKRFLEDEERKKYLAIKKIKNLEQAFISDNYKIIVSNLKNDKCVYEHFKKTRFFYRAKQNIPFYLDIPVSGQIAFNCDRRIWQMALFEQFFYHRKENSVISVIRIWKWFIKYDGKKFINWDYIAPYRFRAGNKQYKRSPALEAIKQYLTYLNLLGFIKGFEYYRFKGDYDIVSKTIVPPNEENADALQIVLKGVDHDTPAIDSDIEEVYNDIFSTNF